MLTDTHVSSCVRRCTFVLCVHVHVCSQVHDILCLPSTVLYSSLVISSPPSSLSSCSCSEDGLHTVLGYRNISRLQAMAGILGLSLMSDTSSENWLMDSLQGEEEEEEVVLAYHEFSSSFHPSLPLSLSFPPYIPLIHFKAV